MSAADGDGAALVAAMIEEMRELYGGLDLNAPDMPTAGVAELASPGARSWSVTATARRCAAGESSGSRTVGVR